MNNKRKLEEENNNNNDDNNDNNTKIRVVSKIKDLNKTPEQVLKLLVYHLQEKYEKEKINYEQVLEKLRNKHSKLINKVHYSEIWTCPQCDQFFGIDRSENCNDCDTDMCYSCFEDHDCREQKCFYCDKKDKELLDIPCNNNNCKAGNNIICNNCIEKCVNCNKGYCKKECIHKHMYTK